MKPPLGGSGTGEDSSAKSSGSGAPIGRRINTKRRLVVIGGCAYSSDRGEPAVNHELAARYKTRLGGAQVDDTPSNLFRIAKAANGMGGNNARLSSLTRGHRT